MKLKSNLSAICLGMEIVRMFDILAWFAGLSLSDRGNFHETKHLKSRAIKEDCA